MQVKAALQILGHPEHQLAAEQLNVEPLGEVRQAAYCCQDGLLDLVAGREVDDEALLVRSEGGVGLG